MRTAAAVTAVALACSSGMVPASADGPLRLAQTNCESLQPTPTAELTNAWQLKRLDMDDVRRIATGKGIKIAVIDTGISTLGSPYFRGGESRFVVFDMIPPSNEGGGSSTIDCTHGTNVASILAAGRRADGDAIGTATDFAGIAPEATVYGYRTLLESVKDKEAAPPGGERKENLSYTIQAVRQAIKDDVDIINLSMVIFEDPQLNEFRAAIEEAIDHGIVVVAAAGNASPGQSGRPYPAAFPGVISVGISNEQDAGDEATYISRDITIGAPGKNLVALDPSVDRQDASIDNQAYATKATGTSFAAPIVSGVVALMLQYERDTYGKTLTPQQVKNRLIGTADRSGVRAPDPFIGYGIVNPLRAITNTTTGTAPKATAEQGENPSVPVDPPRRMPVTSMIGLGVGIAAVIAVLLGLVAAVAIPAARRRRPGH